MSNKNIDWNNLGFGYIKTDKRYVSNYKNGAWDHGVLSGDDMITMSECANYRIALGVHHSTSYCIGPVILLSRLIGMYCSCLE